MRSTRLGRNGPEVSVLGFGCLSLTEYYGAGVDSEAGVRIVHDALARGITFFDSAAMYGAGKNETVLGSALLGRRREVVIATKFGVVLERDGRPAGVDSRPEAVKASCEASLRRLQTEMIDLFFQHRIDRSVPIEETVGAMAALVRAGKVRFLGLSEISATTLRRAHRVHPIAAVQSEYSLWTRDYEDEVIPTLRELGIGFVPFSPLGRGFLSGNLRDLAADDMRRRISPRFDGENLERNLKVVDRIKEIAKEKGITPSQLALAWVLAQGDDMVPIPGTKRRIYLQENVAACDVRLSKSDLARIEEVAPKGFAAGGRYHDMSTVNI